MAARPWNIDGVNISDSLRRALEVCEAAFDAIVDKNADGMIVVNRQGTICFANAAAEAMLGRSTGELLGERFEIPVAAGETAEFNFCKEGGPERVAEMRVVATRWQDKPAFLATLRDVTERKRAAFKDHEAVRLRDEFLAILSHELRNPLAAIANAATVLSHSELRSATFEMTRNVIERQCNQMTRLLEELLDVSRVTRRKVELRREPLDLSQVIAEAVDGIRAQIQIAGQDLVVRMATERIVVDADSVRLQQILVNLLSNASKYSNSGDQIELSADIENEEAVIRVRDFGVGLSPGMLDAVFEPFVQLGSTLDRSEAGLGLGLAIVNGLVDLHGGTVKAASEGHGKGSEFIVRLPRSQSAPKRRPAPVAIEAIDPLRIVIIEDNADVRTMLKTLLEHAGHDVEIAADGLSGVEMIEFLRPQVALVDIGLPALNGYDVARRIRANDECRDVSLVALTGYSQPGDQKRALTSGFDAHLAKPIEFRQLQQLLATAHETKRVPAV